GCISISQAPPGTKMTSRIFRRDLPVLRCAASWNSPSDLGMPEDLPIYSESVLRTRLQFADLDRLKGADLTPVWEKADRFIEQLEAGRNVRQARESVQEMTKQGLLKIKSI